MRRGLRPPIFNNSSKKKRGGAVRFLWQKTVRSEDEGASKENQRFELKQTPGGGGGASRFGRKKAGEKEPGLQTQSSGTD